ncbi:MAG TPA: tRNA lysidine(34) synthetase TilS [Anaeromyxobacteraceae bacterium]|nr:tRNA lysidine(34) synthetase TilS [Anaeromyxobacteraceae bacterium]
MKITRARLASLRPFERAVVATCRARNLSISQGPVLVALSGGPDSTALAAVMAALRDAAVAGPVLACHVDHQLRAGSAADGAACEDLCRSLAVPLHRVRVDVGGGNLQAAARRARYRALRRVADEAGARVIATGHTRTDQAETVLLRLVRGAGARGLAAIPPRRGRLVRPLIDRSRAEILAYLRDRGLGWCEDPSNATPRFDRNRVRSEVMPLLESLRPGVEASLARAADLLREDERALEALARTLLPRGAEKVSRAVLDGAPLAVRARVVRRLWRDATGSRRSLDAGHVSAVLRLLDRPGPGSVSLPGGRVAAVRRGELRIKTA